MDSSSNQTVRFAKAYRAEQARPGGQARTTRSRRGGGAVWARWRGRAR